MKSVTWVLDASALIALLEEAPGAGQIERLIREVARSEEHLLVSVANWGEVFYVSWQRRGEDAARISLEKLKRLPLELVPVDLAQAPLAGELKARHKIPYVDCLAAALAISRDATLVTSDRDFEKLGRRLQVRWLP